MIGFWEPATWPGFELSWHLAHRNWGRGFATEAATTALGHAFKVWRRNKVLSLIDPANLPSIRVAERIGERLDASINHYGRETSVYGLDRETYPRTIAPAVLSAQRAG